MKTLRISKREMAARISRFQDLKPLAATPINAGAPIRGAAGMTMALAVCPPGQGPGLHAHRETYETFTVLKGEFEVRWNDDGGEREVLRPFDTISFPPGVCRQEIEQAAPGVAAEFEKAGFRFDAGA